MIAPAAHPNLLFILADDLGCPPLGYYGDRSYRTPNTDQLAREGLRFTDAYAACPACSPSRAAPITGRYPAYTHVTDFIGGYPGRYTRLNQTAWHKFPPLPRRTGPFTRPPR
jgi:arylsulfatase A